MTYVICWADKLRREAFLGADDKIHGVESFRVDKTQLIYGRWAVAVYGSSLLLSVLDGISYFNDKANRPRLGERAELIEAIKRVGSIVLPRALEWLRRSSISENGLHVVSCCPSGYVILDCSRFELVNCSISDVKHLAMGQMQVELLETQKVWHLGCSAEGALDCHCDSAPSEFTIEFAEREIAYAASALPSYVGFLGGHIWVRNDRILRFAPWDSFEDLGRESVRGEPYYLRQGR